MKNFGWIEIDRETSYNCILEITEYSEVPGGWLFKVCRYSQVGGEHGGEAVTVALTFVPNPKAEI